MYIKYANNTTVYNVVGSSQEHIENSTSHKASLVFCGKPLQSAAQGWQFLDKAVKTAHFGQV